jgi:hypothetical protein
MWHQVMGTNRSRIQANRAEREQLSGDNEVGRAPRGLTRDRRGTTASGGAGEMV